MKKGTQHSLTSELQTESDPIATPPVAEADHTEMSPANGLNSAKIELPKQGGILAALRRSPLVGVELNFTRPQVNRHNDDL